MMQLYLAPGACSFVPHVGLEIAKAAAVLERERIKLDTYKAA